MWMFGNSVCSIAHALFERTAREQRGETTKRQGNGWDSWTKKSE